MNPPRRFATAEHAATALYRSLWPLFHRLAFIAVFGFIGALAVAALACAWNHRRLPMAVASRPRGGSALARASVWLATRTIVRRPAAQAGFFFTLQTLARSVPHRVTMAASVAVALALGVMTGGSVDAHAVASHATIPIRLLALQTWLLIVLIAAFRHLVRVPAEARANWVFHLAWSGDERPYLAGVKCAAVTAIVLPTLLLLFLFHAFVIGPAIAVAHLVVGLCVAGLLLQLMFLSYRKLPFASSYVRSEDVKSAAPLFVVATLATGAAFAAIERAALASTAGTVTFLLALLVAIATLTSIDAERRRLPSPIDLDERPADATQRFALNQ